MEDDILKSNIRYKHERLLSPYETWKLLNIDEFDGFEHLIAYTELGYIRFCAVAFAKKDMYEVCFDVYVKDRNDAKEWIFYESIYEFIDAERDDLEDFMKKRLLLFLCDSGLSYAKCDFPKKTGEVRSGKEGRKK